MTENEHEAKMAHPRMAAGALFFDETDRVGVGELTELTIPRLVRRITAGVEARGHGRCTYLEYGERPVADALTAEVDTSPPTAS